MKKLLISSLIGIFVLLFLPFLLCQGWTAPLSHYLPSTQPEEEAEFTDIYVPVLIDGQVQQVLLPQYLCGVVAAEMPASYDSEALKAQAVAACSYMVYRMENDPDAPEHKGAWVCNDPSHCKGYLSTDQMKLAWGDEHYTQYHSKIASAVASVAGQILTYEGEPVNAVFHAISAGKTERAADVWGQNVPYLQAVESSVDQTSSGYASTVTYTADELYGLLSIINPDTDPSLDVGQITRTDSGGVISAKLGGQTFSGVQLRSALSLRSTNFEITKSDTGFTFDVKGYGHCVGMSQYGAGQLAAAGMTYDEILKTYYTGVTLENYDFT